jgi:hypothetical protein
VQNVCDCPLHIQQRILDCDGAVAIHVASLAFRDPSRDAGTETKAKHVGPGGLLQANSICVKLLFELKAGGDAIRLAKNLRSFYSVQPKPPNRGAILRIRNEVPRATCIRNTVNPDDSTRCGSARSVLYSRRSAFGECSSKNTQVYAIEIG